MNVFAAEAIESPWVWEARPDVWLLMSAIGGAYVWSITSLRKRLPDAPPTVPISTKIRFSVGLAVLWIAVDWPMDRLGDDFLFSAHMVQFLMVTMVSVPFLIAGTPTWLQRELLFPVLSVVNSLTRPVISLGIFQAVLVGTHVPPVVELYATNSFVHFSLHALWILAAGLFWLPILGDRPLVAAPLGPAGKVVYLIAATVAPTIPASFLTWTTQPLYGSYAEAPRVWGVDAVEDLNLAGAIMKLGGGFILWGFIAWIFLSWGLAETNRSRRPEGEPVATVLASRKGAPS